MEKEGFYKENNEHDFPSLLNEIPHAPQKIYMRGDVSALNPQRLKLAIIGTRKASITSQNIAHALAKKCAQSGIVVVSGLAFGIDRAAHEGCLEGGGQTVAVLATDVYTITPHTHHHLGERILQQAGLIVSEYESSQSVSLIDMKRRFLERNRIISGLCQGVIVIEAPEKSGSLNTAQHALEQNRDVFVVPGSINDPAFLGSNNLIKQGAYLITSFDDIIQHYHLERLPTQSPLPLLNENEQKVFLVIQSQSSGVLIDKISELTKLEVRHINQIITSLLVHDSIRESNGRYFNK